jgi:arylsulfatase
MTDSRRSPLLALPLFLLALALGLVAACAKEAPASPARRVILVTCDTLRADHLGCYGYARSTSPNVDAFAEESTLFENGWSCSSATVPAISTLLSGRLPDEIGVSGGNRMLMSPTIETFPEILRSAAIETAAVVSNWVLRRPPPEHGDAGVSQGFATYDDTMDAVERNRDFPERRAEATTDAALAWLGARRPGKDDRFFLWVHYQDPHGPYDPPPELVEDLLAGLPEKDSEIPVGTTVRGLGQIPAYQVIDGERRPSRYRARYDGEIRAFDRAFGRLVAGLRERDLLEHALVIVTADHGESLGEHDRWFCHAENLHADETHVPFLVRYPASSARGGPGSGSRDDARGRRCTSVVSHLDVLPTVLDAFSIPPRASLGSSLFAAELPPDRVVPQTLFPVDSPRRWAALTTEHHRLVFNSLHGIRLFDRRADPGELRDLARDDPETFARILQRGRALLETGAAGVAPAIERADEETARTLRAMGYAGDEESPPSPGGAVPTKPGGR